MTDRGRQRAPGAATHSELVRESMAASSSQLKKIESRIESLSETLSKGSGRKPLSKIQLNNMDSSRVSKGYGAFGGARPARAVESAGVRRVLSGRKSGAIFATKSPVNAVGASSAARKSLGNKPEAKAPNSGGLSSNRRLSLNDFEIGKVLGKGKLGKVYCVRHKQSGYVTALKVMSKKELVDLKLEKNFRREIEIQSNLMHPKISRLYGFFADEQNVYLILEYSMYGELYHHLKSHRRFNDTVASFYIYQVASALEYLHSNNIIHRDIKPENILLSTDNNIKLSDFGWSVRVAPDAVSKRLTICGTLDYLPPEMIESSEHDFSVDIWSLGILCYELLVGKPPFEEIDKNSTYKRIAKVDLKIPSFVSSDASDLIYKLLQKNPKKRLPLNEIMNHPWITKNMPYWPTEK